LVDLISRVAKSDTAKCADCTIIASCLLFVKDKAVPLQPWSGPEGSRKLRFPDFMTTGTGWW
jgi:hypothetical protein